MYVAELDRSWLHSPFSGTGFLITSQGQIEQLRRVCAYVYVDPALSEAPLSERLAAPVTATASVSPSRAANPVAAARRVLKTALDEIAGIVRYARRQAMVEVGALSNCAAGLAEQIIADAEALHWVLRTEDHGGFLCRRAVGTATVATTLGWQLGLDRPALRAVATGGLLLDLGKIAVPVPILAKPVALDGAEQGYVRRHVERGLELIAGRDVPARAVEMVAGHHERMDGSGYPHQLRGTHISLFARIAAIADAYDAMTLNRRYAAAMSPHAALRQLDGLRGEKYDAALVNELAHVLGIYPVGTLVELADGCLGLVCGQRPRHPLQPRLVVTHDAARQPLAEPRIVAASGNSEIVRSLPPHVVPGDSSRLEAALQGFHHAAA
jgi:HD-GYP domain-containing protein (c-di-GMP phosphodiesterase class II)